MLATGGPANPSMRCSGTLIAPNVVLTARHCVSRLPSEGAPCSKTFGAPLLNPRDLWVSSRVEVEAGTHWKNVATWELPEQGSLCGDDVALLVLEGGFDASEATPARAVLGTNELVEIVKSRRFGIAGFGATSPAGASDGKRHSRFDIPVKCVPTIPGFPCDGALEYVESSELSGGAGPCRGDSGGGAIASDDRGVVFGVLSRGGVGDESCAEGIFERTDVWRWLIARTVIRATPSGTNPPAWASAAFPASPAVGELCVGVGSCGAGAECTSLDGRRSFVCARRCDAGCGSGERCEGAVCVASAPAPEEGGCQLAHQTSRASGIVAIQVAALLGLGLRRGRRARR
ncbi:MAG: trypsin-like serine protease [Deltaproteobacteria bacterium]|nr:trypsin-like serine protease [Deltaproteobacteria bacterium]